ncbi:Hypothetical_protein [Hexamita inflata]|uniref:Hypothetical_protein n=1 Tax=Hexamita inflata TaxID=28002 RepID=A0AA86UR13_9EUKA|nr:Hypothetical protein HINF_LOCUS35118 [Hexamita inflata]
MPHHSHSSFHSSSHSHSGFHSSHSPGCASHSNFGHGSSPFGHSAFNIAHIHPGSSFRRSQQEYAPPAVFSFCCISKAEQEQFQQTLDGIRAGQQREIEIYQQNLKKTVPVIGQSEMKVQ